MSLIEMQRDMRAWLTRGESDAARRFGADALPGLAVYQNNYRAQLVACLEDGFPVTRAWVGDAAFHDAIAAHAERVPPSSWTLDAYGRDFPATLGMLFPDDPEIAELAWIDFALGEAFVGPDACALSPDDVADVDWDRATMRMTPTIDLGDLATNATAIWTALAAGGVPPGVEYLPAPAAVLVWRDGLVARFRAIDQHERQALIAIRAGMPFSDLCNAMVEEFGEEQGVARVGAMLGQWLADGLVVGIDHPAASGLGYRK